MRPSQSITSLNFRGAGWQTDLINPHFARHILLEYSPLFSRL